MSKWALVGLAVSVLLLAGCTHDQNAEVRENVKGIRQELGNAAENARKTAADLSLAGRVKSTLDGAKGLDARRINVEATGNAITLRGDVTSSEQAQLAERIAGRVKGVESIANRLTMHIPATPEAAANAPAKPAPSSSE